MDSTPVAADAERNSSNADFVAAVTEANATMQAAETLRQSPIIKALVDQGKLKVVPAIHNLSTGEVEFL